MARPAAGFRADDLEEGEDDLKCSKVYEVTTISALVSFPLLLWVYNIVQRVVAQAAHDYDCDLLLQPKPLVEAAMALSVIQMLLTFYFAISVFMGNRFATVGLFMVLAATYGVLINFPNQLNEKSTFALFNSSASSTTWVVANNNANEYWNNIKTCRCATEACQDLVYKKYFQSFYDGDASDYTKLSTKDEPEKRGPSADHDNPSGASSKKNGDRFSPNANHHEICYTSNFTDGEANKTLCYACAGCEDKFLKLVQKNRWLLGNKLYAVGMLLVIANLIIFLAETWERYLG